MKQPQITYLRHAFGQALTVLVALCAAYFYSFNEDFWLVLSAYVVCQTTKGTPIKQSIILSFLLMTSIFIYAFLQSLALSPVFVYSLVVIVFALSHYFIFIIFNYEQEKILPIVILPFSLLLAFLFVNHKEVSISHDFIEMIMGAMIGTIGTFILSTRSLAKEFSASILPTLKAIDQYSELLQQFVSKTDINEQLLLDQSVAMNNTLLYPYPRWVYETGFNRGLRSGFRYFLIHVEQLIEIFFSMELSCRDIKNSSGMGDLSYDIASAMNKNTELLKNLIYFFEHSKMMDIKNDYISDITVLEEKIKNFLPSSLELVDVATPHISLLAVLRDIKDSREKLLQLNMSLLTK